MYVYISISVYTYNEHCPQFTVYIIPCTSHLVYYTVYIVQHIVYIVQLTFAAHSQMEHIDNLIIRGGRRGRINLKRQPDVVCLHLYVIAVYYICLNCRLVQQRTTWFSGIGYIYCTPYTIRCTVCKTYCTEYKEYPMYTIYCTVYNVHCTLYIVQSTLYKM